MGAAHPERRIVGSSGAAHIPPIRHVLPPPAHVSNCHSEAPRGISGAPPPNHPPPPKPTYTRRSCAGRNPDTRTSLRRPSSLSHTHLPPPLCGGGRPTPFQPIALIIPNQIPPKTHPFTPLHCLSVHAILVLSDINSPTKEEPIPRGNPPRPNREDSTPRPTPKALAQARGSSRGCRPLFPWSHVAFPQTPGDLEDALDSVNKSPPPREGAVEGGNALLLV